MKIAIITERTNISLGGAERSVFELSAAISAFGHQVHIVAAKGLADTKNIHILYKDSSGERVGYPEFEKALKEHFAQNSYDIIHSVLPFDFADIYQPRGGTYAESIIRNAASYQNRFVEYYKKITAFANYRRMMLLQAERKFCSDPKGPLIAALSKYVADQFRTHYNTGEQRLIVIPNGVKINKQPDNTEIRQIRYYIFTRLGIKEKNSGIIMLFAANNFRLKGLGPLIKAMHTASSKYPARRVYLAVAGRDNPGKYRRLAKRLGIQDRIVFLGAIKHINSALSVSDIAVLPTFYDPASRFILEALAAQKPVITTRFNGASDLFVNDRHGKIIDRPDDIPALAGAIGHFSNIDNIKTASQSISADNLKENISVNRAAKQLICVYESIAEKRGY